MRGKIGKIWFPNCELVGKNVMLVCISINRPTAVTAVGVPATAFIPDSTCALPDFRLKLKFLTQAYNFNWKFLFHLQ